MGEQTKPLLGMASATALGTIATVLFVSAHSFSDLQLVSVLGAGGIGFAIVYYSGLIVRGREDASHLDAVITIALTVLFVLSFDRYPIETMSFLYPFLGTTLVISAVHFIIETFTTN